MIKTKPETYKLRIVYKSGYVQDIECDKFTITTDGDGITKIAWTNVKPDPLFIGVSNIESIFRR